MAPRHQTPPPPNVAEEQVGFNEFPKMLYASKGRTAIAKDAEAQAKLGKEYKEHPDEV